MISPVGRLRQGLIIGTAALVVALVADDGAQPVVEGRAAAEASQAAEGRSGVKLKRVGRFKAPVFVTGAPGFPRLVFVVEQRGRIRVLRGGRKLRRPFLDIRGIVAFNYEQGLFSVAFHPNYRRNRLFYVFYNDRRGDLRIDEFKRRGRLRAARGSRRTVMRIRHPGQTTHNGGQLQFLGRLLYIATGDGGGPGDPGDDAKDKRSLLGKILRINPRNPKGRALYSIPRSNPFVGRRGRNAIFSYGLRNPWRFSFDRVSAEEPRIVIADVGQEIFEEVNYETLGSARGAFFGWDEYEGFARYECDGSCARRRERPIHVYTHASGCSITGGYVVGDRRLPGLYGRYLFADLCAGRVRSIAPRLRRVRGSRPTGLRVGYPVSFGEDRRRRVYVTSLNGPVYRIDPR
jgi:glucose/arabinose dehydrogenase